MATLIPLWALIAAVIILSGCVQSVPVRDTLPSPVDQVAEGSFQLRLHQTNGSKVVAGEGGLLARPYLDGEVNAGGVAIGCTLTQLGNPHPRLNIHLKAGECRVEVVGDP